MSFTQKHVSVGNYVCAALTLILMVCMFVPFWTVAETGETYSIGTYVGFPQDNPELLSYLETSVGESYSINSVVIAPAMIIALGAVGVLLCLIKNKLAVCAAVPAVTGAIGVWGYLSQTALQLGAGWALHLILCVALLVAGVATICIGVKTAKK